MERKIRKTIAIRKGKRWFVLVLISIAVSSPFFIILAVDYSAVNNAQLIIDRVFYNSDAGQTNGSLLVFWRLHPAGQDYDLTTSDTTYVVTINGVSQPYQNCASLVRPDGTPYSCDLLVPGISGQNLNGSILGLTVSGVASFYGHPYKQRMSRSATFPLCGPANGYAGCNP